MLSASGRELTNLLDRLAGGARPQAAELALLSDLGSDDALTVRRGWPLIPLDSRTALLARASELAEDNLDLDFTALACIALADEFPEVRARAADALWEATDRWVAALLRDRLDDDDSDVRTAAASSLRQFVALRELGRFDAIEGDAVIDALRARAEDPAEALEVRGAAIEALGARSAPWVAGLISDAYDSDERELRLAAIHAMGESGDDRWLDYLHDQFYADDPEFRFEAVTSAARVGSEESVPVLAELLRDDDSEVVVAAIEALGEIGGDAALEALEAYAPDAPAEFSELLALSIESAREGFGLGLGDHRNP
jgi:HEAT repeat protein